MSQTTRLITLTPDQLQSLVMGQPIIFQNVDPAYQPHSKIQPIQVVQPNINPSNVHPAPPPNPNATNGYPPNGYPPGVYPPNVHPPHVYPPPNPPQPQIYNNMTALQQMYNENLICLWVTYEVLLLLCLILQFVGCQSPSAGNLWISIEVFLITIGLGNYGFWSYLQQQTYKNIAFGIQLFFFVLITILEIPAFALAVKYPTLIQYYIDINQVGDCIFYSESFPDGTIAYQGVAQFILLIIFLIQFFYSAYFTYQIGKKNWIVFKYLRNLPSQQDNQYQQPQPNQVIVHNVA